MSFRGNGFQVPDIGRGNAEVKDSDKSSMAEKLMSETPPEKIMPWPKEAKSSVLVGWWLLKVLPQLWALQHGTDYSRKVGQKLATDRHGLGFNHPDACIGLTAMASAARSICITPFFCIRVLR